MANLWQRIRGAFSPQRAAPALPGMTDGVAPAAFPGRGPPRRGTRELLAAYRTQPWLRAVTGRIARGVSSAGWQVYARAATPSSSPTRFGGRTFPGGHTRDVTVAPPWQWGRDRIVPDRRLASPDPITRAKQRVELAAAGLLREVHDHPLLALLETPNPDISGRAALAVSQTWIDLKGEAFWLIVPNGAGVPAGYVPIPPHWITQTPTRESPTFTLSFNAWQAKIDASAIVWFRDLDPENPHGRGAGVAESLGDELETDEAAAKYLAAWFGNSAMPSFIVSFEGAGLAELEKAKEKWNNEHRGYWNSHRAHFSSGKMNAIRLDSSFRDQQIIDLRKLSRDTVAQVFAVPPEVIGIIENSNRSTISAARYIYALGVEFPRVEFLRTELQRQLLRRFPGSEGAVLEAEVAIPEDEQRRLDVLKAMPAAFDLNEWRAEAGYDPRPEFDGVFVAMPGQAPATAGGLGEGGDGEQPAADQVCASCGTLASECDGECCAGCTHGAEDDDEGETELEPEQPGRGDPAWVASLRRPNH
jgi:HK97 family phage portal protein